LKVGYDNWFLRFFSPTIQFEYDLESWRALWYRGISMVPKKDNKSVEIVATYDYPYPPPCWLQS